MVASDRSAWAFCSTSLARRGNRVSGGDWTVKRRWAVAALVTYLAIRAAQRALHEHDTTDDLDTESEPNTASEPDDSVQKPR